MRGVIAEPFYSMKDRIQKVKGLEKEMKRSRSKYSMEIDHNLGFIFCTFNDHRPL